MSATDIRRRFGELGWDIVTGGKHDFAVLGKKKIRMPNPHEDDPSVDLIRRMIRDAGISRDDWLNL